MSTAVEPDRRRNRLAEVISVSQLARVNDDFAHYRAEICYTPITFVAMSNQFGHVQLGGANSGAGAPDDQACIQTFVNVY